MACPPAQVWAPLDDPRSWAPLFVSPGAAAPRRVKVLDGVEAAPGRHLQVLRADHRWTVYRIDRWEPGRQVRLVAVGTGERQEPGGAVAGQAVERLILIPQGDDTEAEWTVDRRGAVWSRLLAEPGADAWGEALEERLDVLGALVPARP